MSPSDPDRVELTQLEEIWLCLQRAQPADWGARIGEAADFLRGISVRTPAEVRQVTAVDGRFEVRLLIDDALSFDRQYVLLELGDLKDRILGSLR